MPTPRWTALTSALVLTLLGFSGRNPGVESATTDSTAARTGQWDIGVAVNTCAKGQLRPCT